MYVYVLGWIERLSAVQQIVRGCSTLL